MESVKERRICVKLCLKAGKPAESHNTLHEAYSNDASSQITTCERFKVLKMEHWWMTMSNVADLQPQDPY
jgi:hypothetical protein